MIRECTAADAERICFVVNEAAEAYRGVGGFDLRDESRSYGGVVAPHAWEHRRI
jgi:hypothetical protein